MNTPCNTYEWVMSIELRKCHESRNAYEQVITHVWVRHVIWMNCDPTIHMTRLANCSSAIFCWVTMQSISQNACNMTHSDLWMCVAVCIAVCFAVCFTVCVADDAIELRECVRLDSFIHVTWCIHMCDMTHSYAWHDAFICVTWLTHLWHNTVIWVPCVL